MLRTGAKSAHHIDQWRQAGKILPTIARQRQAKAQPVAIGLLRKEHGVAIAKRLGVLGNKRNS